MSETTLDSLRPGERARIVQVQGDDGVAARIMEMGLIDGEGIELLGRAPLGDPLEFFVQGYRVSLRIAEARRVVIEPLAPQMTKTKMSYEPARQAPPDDIPPDCTVP